MKKQIKYLLSLAALLIVAACTETVGLDDGVDKRVNKVITGYIDELSSAENGWIANISTSQGVYQFWMEFTDKNDVTMYTDNLAYKQYKNKPETSTYNIRSLMLPTLSFDTYSYIHIINDPDNSISGGSENQGLKTDFEFEIISYKDDVFTLKGRMNRVPATLTRATAEQKQSVQQGGLMGILEETVNYKEGQYCGVKIGKSDIGVILRPRQVNFVWLDSRNNGKQLSANSYVSLNRDILFVEPTTVNGSQVAAIRWNKDTETYTIENTDGSTIPMGVSNTPYVSLYDLFGSGNAYSQMQITYDMYATPGMSNEELEELANTNAFFKNLKIAKEGIASSDLFGDGTKLKLLYTSIHFYKSNGQSRMMLQLFSQIMGYSQIITAAYSFPLTVNDATKQVSVGTSMKSEAIDENIKGASEGIYAECNLKPLCDMLKMSTFAVEWASAGYGTELMGQLRLVDASSKPAATIFGALY